MSEKLNAFFILTGTIIGAGILGIPFVVSRTGFAIGATNILAIGAIILFITLCLGEVSLRTKKEHQLPGYAEKYLGKTGKKITLFAFIFGIYSALIAYLIGEGESISFLLINSTTHSIKFGILFWIALSLLNLRGIKSFKRSEFYGVLAAIILIISLLILNWNSIDAQNLSYNNFQLYFIPLGVILFAYLGFPAVPEIKKVLGKERNSLKKVIIFSYISIALIYIIFCIIIVGKSGINTPEIATFALGKPFVMLGMITIFTAYLSLSISLIDMLILDFNKSKLSAWSLTNFPPLIIFILLTQTNLAGFTKVLGIGGAITGVTIGTIILMMHSRAKKLGEIKPEYSIVNSKILKFIIIAILIAAAIFEIINL